MNDVTAVFGNEVAVDESKTFTVLTTLNQDGAPHVVQAFPGIPSPRLVQSIVDGVGLPMVGTVMEFTYEKKTGIGAWVPSTTHATVEFFPGEPMFIRPQPKVDLPKLSLKETSVEKLDAILADLMKNPKAKA